MEKYEEYIGTVLDKRYKIEKLCGVGGMAIVFRAEDILMKRTVAIKMLKDDMANDAESVHRFINESKAVAMLSHENIVNIYDVSVKEKQKYIVMEYIEGINLKTYVKRKGNLSLTEMLNIVEQILRALDHAHSKGVIHRDIKPQNILVLKNGIVKVADFGIAKLPDTDTLTASDKAIGTVHYVSPEQASASKTDSKSDLYSVGVMLYELACGKLPFVGDTPVQVAMKQVNEEPESPRDVNPEIPMGLEQIILRAMEKSPETRYQSAKQMMKHIRALKENPNIMFRPAGENPSSKKGKNKKEDKTNKHVIIRGTSLMPTVYGVLAAFLIVVSIVVIILFYHISDSMQDTSKEMEVVQCIGNAYSQAYVDELESMGFSVTVKFTSVVSEKTEVNTIVNQNPTAGITKKYVDTLPLEITVYIGEEEVELPDFTMKMYSDVVKENQTKHSFVLRETKEYNDAIPEGYVIRTEPVAGSSVKPDSIVTVYVSKGEKTMNIIMPYVVGMDGTEAIKLLVQCGFVIGDVKYLPDDDARNVVTKQSLAENAEFPRYTVVDLILSEGGAPEDSDAVDSDNDDLSSQGGIDTPSEDTYLPREDDFLPQIDENDVIQ